MYGVNDNMYLKVTYNLKKEIRKQRNGNLLFGHKLLVNKRRLIVFLQKPKHMFYDRNQCSLGWCCIWFVTTLPLSPTTTTISRYIAQTLTMKDLLAIQFFLHVHRSFTTSQLSIDHDHGVELPLLTISSFITTITTDH